MPVSCSEDDRRDKACRKLSFTQFVMLTSGPLPASEGIERAGCLSPERPPTYTAEKKMMTAAYCLRSATGPSPQTGPHHGQQ